MNNINNNFYSHNQHQQSCYNNNYSDGEMLSIINEYNCNNNNSAVIERFHMRQNQRIQHQRKFVSLDGIQSGVPTLTTSTLTPTTLRNIEQTFIELTSDPAVSSPYQAGFVPPPAPFVNFIDNSNDNNSMGATSESGSQSSWHTPSMHEDNNSMATDTSSLGNSIHMNGGSPGINLQINGSIPAITVTSNRKNTGGRRPTKSSNLSPEEEEKRKIRRERNKLAAARCRKRRVDQTNELQEKVDKLEKEKEALQREIEHFNALKDELKFSLEAHRSHCRQHHHNNSSTTILLPSTDTILMNVANNNNNSNNNKNNNINSNQQRSISPIDIKPVILKNEYDSTLIKNEPIDDSLDGPPSPKRIMLSSTIPLQLPNVSTISTTIANAQMLNTPTITTSPPPPLTTATSGSTTIYLTGSNRNQQQQISIAKARPSSLNVPLTLKPSQALNINKIVNELGVPISTPSTGTFNFESLMDGGTGLTPVSGPLMPTCSTHSNKHPLELTTPTNEPSKLVSL